MAAHWRRAGKGTADRMRGSAINGFGAVATGAALAIILAAKFIEGAWLTIVVIPAALILLRLVHRYYVDLDRQLLSGSRPSARPARATPPPLVVIPIGRWDRISRKAVAYALRLSPDDDRAALHRPGRAGSRGARGPDPRGVGRYVEQPAREAGLHGAAAAGRALALSQRGRPARCAPSRICNASSPAGRLRSSCRNWSRRAGGRCCCTRTASGACARPCFATADRRSLS